MATVPPTTTPSPRDPRRLATAAVRLLAVTAVYLAAGRIGLLEQVVIGGAKVTPLWPPTGIALTCLLLYGLRVWPAVALGAFLVVVSSGPPTWGTLGIVAGNTLAPVAAYLMLRRAGFRIEMGRLRDGMALVFLGAFAGMLISSSIGTAVLVLNGDLPADGFWSTWSAWWTGDAMGVLVITPLLLALSTARLPADRRPFDLVEPVLLLAGTAGATVLATSTRLSVLFLVFPFLIWAALRFQVLGAAPCVLLVSVITITAATNRAGPFAGHGLVAAMVMLQALNGCAALTSLLLAAVVAEQRDTYRRIEQATVELAEVVNRLAPGKADTSLWLPPEDGGR
ncbi:MASE1 domain-containing protein [Streptomyces sp. NRRL WC-3742]|uniref:MASE1 domain-containing protein n=1 Tax=Streptomyces sp. NRRL WC-3742 TaxID=1463934 RepID=UPI00068C7C89|nr:MASE1 domain-containing protein [Streptomyces sp. NRRL WC-3742]